MIGKGIIYQCLRVRNAWLSSGVVGDRVLTSDATELRERSGSQMKHPWEKWLTVWAYNSVFEAELQDVVPICRATVAGTRIVGRLTAG